MDNELKGGIEPIQALEAIRLYLKVGSIAAVAREMEIDLYELQKLSRGQWWAEQMISIRRMEQAELDASLTEILGKSLKGLVDRLERGEEYTDKDGNTRLRDVSASTLCRITETVFDKRQLLRGLPTAVSNEGSKLAELAAKLEKLGAAQAARTVEMEPTLPEVKRLESSSFDIEE